MTKDGRRDTSIGPFIPLILVAMLVFVVIDRRSDGSDRQVQGQSAFSHTAFLSGVERTYSSSNFRKGEAEAFMGGVEIDLRDAMIEGDEARLEITAIMGGIKIRVPRTWIVVNRVVPVLGGVKDETRSRDGNKRLVIEGTVLMGGLEIEN